MKRNIKLGRAKILFADKQIAGSKYFVRYVGGNGEIISSSETLSSKQKCIVNILSHISLTRGQRMIVIDCTTKKDKMFIIKANGEKTMI